MPVNSSSREAQEDMTPEKKSTRASHSDKWRLGCVFVAQNQVQLQQTAGVQQLKQRQPQVSKHWIHG
jgi:hypothetical protein